MKYFDENSYSLATRMFGCTLQHLTFPARAYLFIYACIGLVAVALSSVLLGVSSALHLHCDEKQDTRPKQGRGIVATWQICFSVLKVRQVTSAVITLSPAWSSHSHSLM